MFKSTAILVVVALLGACHADPADAPDGFCGTAAQSAVSMMVDAHGAAMPGVR